LAVSGYSFAAGQNQTENCAEYTSKDSANNTEQRNPESSNPELSKAELSKEEPVDVEQGLIIHANEVSYLPEESLKLNGNIEFTHGPYKARSEKAIVDNVQQKAELSGDIILSSPELILTGDSATLDITSKNVSVVNASFSNPTTSINGSASEITRRDENTLIIRDGLFTSCPPEKRDWAFASEKITLDRIEGFGQARNTRFLIKDTPVLYIPWFSFPIDNRRQSGFLYPSIGSSNTERGIFLSTPYYFNLAPEYDATFTPSYIHDRGVHSDLELRHKSAYTDSELNLGYINEDKYYNNKQGIINSADKKARWGINFSQDIDAQEHDWYGSLRYSQISDFDYLDDLNQGLNIDRNDNLDRRAEFHFARENWRVSTVFQQYKSIDDTLLANEQAYQRLPEVNYEFDFIYRHLQLDWHSQYVYFYRDDEGLIDDERAIGSRVRHKPKLSLPFSKSWGYVTPAVSLDHTDYFLEKYTPVENHVSRTIPIYELDAALFFDRTSLFSENSFFKASKIRHSLEPRVYYVNAKSVDQDALPNFDSALPSFNFHRLFSPYRFSGGDRVGDNNSLTLGITNRWTDMRSGIEKAAVSIGQVYHYSDRLVGIDGVGQANRKDSLLAAEIVLRPYPGLEIATSGMWDARENKTYEGNSSVHLHTQDYKYLVNFSHRYISGELEQVDTSFIAPLYQQTSLIGRWRYDLDDERTIGSLAGLEFGSCCWRIQLLGQSYLNSDSEVLHGFLFRFQLSGVRGFGQSSRKMDQHIPGYSAREEFLN
jgi:LPS-assembly protein